MPQRLKNGEKRVGVKQSRKAIREGRAKVVFVAEDADPRVTAPILELCIEKQAQSVSVPSMQTIGECCGIEVGSAVAVLLN